MLPQDLQLHLAKLLVSPLPPLRPHGLSRSAIRFSRVQNERPSSIFGPVIFKRWKENPLPSRRNSVIRRIQKERGNEKSQGKWARNWTERTANDERKLDKKENQNQIWKLRAFSWFEMRLRLLSLALRHAPRRKEEQRQLLAELVSIRPLVTAGRASADLWSPVADNDVMDVPCRQNGLDSG